MILDKLKRERRQVFLFILALSFLGLLIIYSASCIHAWKAYGDAAYFFKKQFLFLLISVLIFFSILFVDINILRKFNKEFLIFTIFLLVVVLFIGRKAGGARRWIQFGFFNFQPSELLKIAFPLYMADYFVRKRALIKDFKQGILPLFLVCGITFALIVLEPDLGTVIFWLVWMFLMLFVVRARSKHLLLILLLGLLASIILIKTHPYRFARFVSYLNPWQDSRGSGFQIIQSQIAFGEGGLFGVGLGAGRQKLLFLPAAHTDFVFSIIAEEFGFLGSLGVLSVYFIIFVKMMRISQGIDDVFFKHICCGIALVFGLEAVINVGVSCGLLPTKGMVLPFISYGGTNLLMHYILLGIFFNVTRRYESTLSV